MNEEFIVDPSIYVCINILRNEFNYGTSDSRDYLVSTLNKKISGIFRPFNKVFSLQIFTRDIYHPEIDKSVKKSLFSPNNETAMFFLYRDIKESITNVETKCKRTTDLNFFIFISDMKNNNILLFQNDSDALVRKETVDFNILTNCFFSVHIKSRGLEVEERIISRHFAHFYNLLTTEYENTEKHVDQTEYKELNLFQKFQYSRAILTFVKSLNMMNSIFEMKKLGFWANQFFALSKLEKHKIHFINQKIENILAFSSNENSRTTQTIILSKHNILEIMSKTKPIFVKMYKHKNPYLPYLEGNISLLYEETKDLYIDPEGFYTDPYNLELNFALLAPFWLPLMIPLTRVLRFLFIIKSLN